MRSFYFLMRLFVKELITGRPQHPWTNKKQNVPDNKFRTILETQISVMVVIIRVSLDLLFSTMKTKSEISLKMSEGHQKSTLENQGACQQRIEQFKEKALIITLVR